MMASDNLENEANESVDTVDRFSPGFASDYNKYIQQNPAYGTGDGHGRFSNPQVDRELFDIFYKDRERQEPRTDAAIGRRIKVLHGVIRSKLRQMEGNPLWAQYGPATPEEYDASPRSMAKTVIDIGSHSTERIALKKREEGNDPATLGRVILDSRRNTNTRLRNLGLDRFLPPKGADMVQRGELRNQAVEAVRDMLMALEPIRRPDEKDPAQGRYFRLMRTVQGYLVGTQHVYTGREGEREKTKTLFKTDLYDSSLRLKEIDKSYEDEIGILKMIEELLNSIIADLDAWRNLDPATREKISETMGKCIDQLENVDDPDKIKLREMVKRAITLKDIKGRFNPQAKIVQIERAKDYLGARLQTIEESWEYLAKDSIKVEQIRASNIQPMALFLRKVEATHRSFSILNPSQPLNWNKKAAMIRNLEYMKGEAAKMTFEPLLSFSQKFIVHIEATIKALNDGDQHAAATQFMNMYVLTKAVHSMDRLKATYERVALSPETINPDDLEKELQSQKDLLKNQEVARDINTENYDRMFVQYFKLYNKLLRQLRLLKGTELNPVPKDAVTEEEKTEAVAEATATTTLQKAIATLKSALPALQSFLDQLGEKVSNFVNEKRAQFYGASMSTKKTAAKPAQAPEATEVQPPYSMEDKLARYKKLKTTIKAFDHAALIRAVA